MIKTFFARFMSPAAVAAMALAPLAIQADMISMSATYYTIAENDQDMGHLASGVFNNEVQTLLGSDDLPVLNTTAFGCASGCFSPTNAPADVTAGGEISWWSPALSNGGRSGSSDVVLTGTGTITLPYDNGSFYPSNGNDADGFEAAVFSTTLNVPTTESISFNVGADDVAFVYLDGSVVCDLGGVHANSPGACTSGTLTAGNHSLELFYADLERSGAALTFGVTTAGVTGSPTPEPSTLAMMLAAALAGFGVIRRSRKA